MFENARVAIVAAHPDDETIGAGAQLASMNATIIHVTDGAPRSRPDWRDYARARRAELLEAMAIAGIPADRCLEIGLPDQQASLHLVELACHLSRLLRDLAPDIVLTHPYEGGHPDHEACAFAVHRAAACEIQEFCSYHRNPLHDQIETGCFLGPATPDIDCIVLDAEARERKSQMIACFRTQAQTLEWFRNSALHRECFRRAPSYDFRAAPQSGKLFYEFFNWGVDSAEWLRLARHADRVIPHV